MLSSIFFLPFLLCLSGDVFGQEVFPFRAEVIERNVVIRAGQNVNFEKIGLLQSGDMVIVEGREFSWYKIQLPSIAKSYISEKYILLKENDKAEIAADRVNVRAGASVNASIVGQLGLGALVTVLEKNDGWYQIIPPSNSYGWVSDKFLTFKSRDILSEASFLTSSAKENQKASLSTDSLNQDVPIGSSREDQPLLTGERVSVKGQLVSLGDQGTDTISHQIVVDGQAVYNLKTSNIPLSRFRFYTVTLDGFVDPQYQGMYAVPVIDVSKIELIF